jgi:nitrogen-specific signal transduction histidine kinase/ActR/RegA family two-component response regulator
MEPIELTSQSIDYQWSFYERAINNYSMIMKMLHCLEEEDSLIKLIPKAFVEGSVFDMCKIIRHDEEQTREGFFSIEEDARDVDHQAAKTLTSGAISPSLMKDVAGYGVLYIYPLRKDMQPFGYLVLGKKVYVELDARLLRELEIVCDIYSKLLLLHGNLRNHKQAVDSKTVYECVVNEFPDAMFLVDRNGCICHANWRAKAEFETTKGFLLGERIDNIVSGLNGDFYKKDTVLQGEVRYKVGDKYKLFKVESYPIKEAYDKGVWKGIIFKDVVEKKIKDEEQVLKEKMESIGMLAGGIAHDFNNLLTGVLGYASLIKNFLSNEEKLYRYAEAIESSAQRAAKLAQHLLNFSRRQRRTTGIVDLNALLDDLLFLIKESFRDIEIERSFDEGLYPIKGDEAELQNVFLNICINAKDAMEGKGTLRVKTERKKYIGGKHYAAVQIEDTGRGIDDEVKAKIFEPYFTTKETRTNLGMGLYLVDKIIREHGGFIEFESEKGKGTKFSLYLPLPTKAPAEQVTVPEKEDSSAAAIQKQKILVVDDEDVVREFIKGVLAEESVEIIEAPDGSKALQIFEASHDTIDLVILDMIMPGLKGDEVLKEMRNIKKDIRVIISSGYMSEEQRERLKKYNVDAFLDKPFRDKDVIQTIIKVLSSKGSQK